MGSTHTPKKPEFIEEKEILCGAGFLVSLVGSLLHSSQPPAMQLNSKEEREGLGIFRGRQALSAVQGQPWGFSHSLISTPLQKGRRSLEEEVSQEIRGPAHLPMCTHALGTFSQGPTHPLPPSVVSVPHSVWFSTGECRWMGGWMRTEGKT